MLLLNLLIALIVGALANYLLLHVGITDKVARVGIAILIGIIAFTSNLAGYIIQ